MDPLNSAQDVVRCSLCKTAVAPMHCKICYLDLCKDCVVQHISDISKDHNVVPLKQRGPNSDYLKCPKHFTNKCELRCQQCDTLICDLCASSQEHRGHTIFDKYKTLEIKKEELQRDLEELEKNILPKYQEIASNIPVQKADLHINSQTLTIALNKHGEELHKRIDTFVRKLKSTLCEIDSENLTVLSKQEDEVAFRISEIKQSISYLNKLLNSNEICTVSSYNSRNHEFRILPTELPLSLPIFTPPNIKKKQISNLFGSFSALYGKRKDGTYSVDTKEVEPPPPDRPLLDEPSIITSIDTEHQPLYNLACLEDEKIWTCGADNIISLYNLHGEVIKSIQTKSGNEPADIAVTRSGDLVYTDYKYGTLNIVKNSKIEEVIRLRGWRPLNICCSSSGSLLVILMSHQQTKIVRYSHFKEKQNIQFNNKGQPLYSSGYIKFICENKNLDICVADCDASAVVVVNKAGKFRFTYNAPPSSTKGPFSPYGISTDSQGRILTADHNNNYIHILDQNGSFLRFIDNCDLDGPYGLCVDTKNNLFVVECRRGKMKKIQYYM